ncbi:carotenoid biosynthesis protein [Domibacillus sp. A3M-37]|nr:carotenoid biosynthesis protein [Domibacillus sp. A3M-37]
MFIISWSIAIELFKAETGLIFGHYYYEKDFGVHVAGVPVTIGFAWLVVIQPLLHSSVLKAKNDTPPIRFWRRCSPLRWTWSLVSNQNGIPLVNAHTANSRNRYWSHTTSPVHIFGIRYYYFHINENASL